MSLRHKSYVLRAISNGKVSDKKSGSDAHVKVSASPLLDAARDKKPETLECLLKNGAHINKANKNGETPLLAAISSDNPENALFLLRHGADGDCMDKLGCSALIAACQKGLEDVVAELLVQGVDVNHRDESGWTALMWSISSLKRKSYSIVKRLLDANADVQFKYDSIGTVYDYAKSLYCDEVAQLISEFEEKPEEIFSHWEYLKDQMENKWTLIRDVANILDKCYSLRALDYVLEEKKMDLAEFLSQTPQEINKLPTLTHRKQRLNKMLRKFHLQQWRTECLGLDFMRNVSKQEVSALAQITFLASVARQLTVMSGGVIYIQKNMLRENEDNAKLSLALAEIRHAVLLVKSALRSLSHTMKEEKVRPADWIPPNIPQNRRGRIKQTVVVGGIFVMSIVFVCWESCKLFSKFTAILY